MGWASATYIFDAAVNVAMEYAPVVFTPTGAQIVPQDTTREIVKSMYKNLPLDDWDTQDESIYFNDHLIHIMHEMDELDDDYYETWTSHG